MKSPSLYYLVLIGLLTRWVGYISPALGARIFALVWFKVSKPRANPNRAAWLEACQKSFVPHRGKELPVYTRVPSTPRGKVVLLHGWSGRWDQLLTVAETLFAADFEVTVFDFPAHGENAGDESNLFELSEFLKSAFETLGLNSPIVVGHSAAFLTLSHSVLKRNLGFSKLITIGSPARFNYLIEVSREKVGFSKRLDAELWKVIERKTGVTDPQAQLRTDHMSEFNSNCVFVIHDRDDKEVKFDELGKMKAIWSNPKMLVTNGLGHNRILSNKMVADEITSFCVGG